MSLAKGAGGGGEGRGGGGGAAAGPEGSGGTATLAPLRTPGASRRIGRTFPANALVEAYSSADHPNRFRAVASAPGAPRSRRTVASRPYWDAHMSAVLPLASRWFTSSEARRRSTAATSPRRAARCSSGLARVVPEPNMSGEGGGGGGEEEADADAERLLHRDGSSAPTDRRRPRARGSVARPRAEIPDATGVRTTRDMPPATRRATRRAARARVMVPPGEHLRALFVVAGTWRHNHAGERGISSLVSRVSH